MDVVNLILLFFALVSDVLQVSGARAYEQRGDLLDEAIPVKSTGWTVPLSNGHGQSLPPVPQGQGLAFLALGRGHRTFSCNYKGIHNLTYPVAVKDTAILINVAPLLFYISDEDAFHKLPAEILSFDYSQLNTSYDCIGSWNRTTDFAGVFALEGQDEFPVNITHIIEAPNMQHDEPWFSGYSVDAIGTSDGEWTYYVVETAGGARPDCGKSHDGIKVEYAAEFWLYRKGS